MRVVLFFFLIVPALLNAENVRIRAADHDGFTRIALDVSDSNVWKAQQLEKSLVITSSSTDLKFDYSNVFQRISRQRITGVNTSTEKGVEFALACDCKIRSFAANASMFVVDVISAKNEKRRSNDNARSMKTLKFNQVDPIEVKGKPSLKRRLTFRAQIVRKKNNVLKLPIAPPPRSVVEGDKILPKERQPKQLVQVPDAPLETSGSPAFTSQIRFREATGKMGQVQEIVSDTLNVNVNACAEYQYLDPTGWGLNREQSDQFLFPNLHILTERNKWDQLKIEELATAYLALGLGYEVRLISQLLEDEAKKTGLNWVAGVVENQTFEAAPMSEGLHDCEALSLWKLLSGSNTALVDPRAVMTQFDAIPLTLKQRLADRLSSILTKHNHLDAAEFVLRSAEGLSTGFSVETPVAKASIDIKRGRIEQAEAGLVVGSKAGGIEGAKATAALIDLKINRGSSVSEADQQKVEVLAVEMRESETEGELLGASIKADIQRSDFQAAFSKFERFIEISTRSQARMLQAYWVNELVQSAQDLDFLLALKIMPKTFRKEMLQTEADILGDRAVKLGFPWLAKPNGVQTASLAQTSVASTTENIGGTLDRIDPLTTTLANERDTAVPAGPNVSPVNSRLVAQLKESADVLENLSDLKKRLGEFGFQEP